MEDNNQPNDNLEPKTEEKEQQNVDPISDGQTNNFNISSQEPLKTNGNSKNALLLVGFILIIAIVAGLIYYFSFYTKPEQMYKKLIGSSIDSYTDKLKDADYKTLNTSFKFSANVKTDSDEIDEDILELINKTDIGLNLQTNNEEKQLIVNLESNYDKKSLLNMQVYSNIDDEKTYIYAKDLLDKYIETEVDDEFYSSLSELLDSQKVSSEEKLSLQKAMQILKNELTNIIKPEYCSSQKEDININDKKVSVTKNTIKMNAKQLKDEFTSVSNNLRDNEEFLNCFKDKDDVKDVLDNLLDSLEDLDDDDKSTVEMNLYTKGLMQEVVKFSITAYSEEEDETVTISFTKTEENKYYFEALANDNESVLTGSINIEQKDDKEGIAKLEFNVEEFGKIAINIEYSTKYNEEIDNVNVKKSVKADELTTTDQKTLMTNLQKSKLYELIESFSGTSLIGNTNNTTNNNVSITDDEDEDNKSAKTNDNEIISYDDKYKITFKVPTGYESRYVSDNYRSLDKDDISVKIATSYSNKDKYYENLQKNVKSYEEQDRYENIELSEMKNIEVNGRTFYYATFSYVYSSGSYESKYSTKYIWSEISDKYVVDIQIRGEKDMTTEELNEILTMTVEENK